MIQIKRLALLAIIAAAVTLSACGSAEDRAEKYLTRAQTAFDAEDYVKASLDIKNTLQIDPDNVDARYMLAQIGEKERNPRQMFSNLRMVVELDPTHIDARVKLGSIFLLTGEVDQASEHAEAALAQDPNNHNARILRASILRKLGDVEGSMAEAEAVLAEDPGHIPAVSLLASAFAEHEPDRAIALLDAGVSNSDDPGALLMLKVALLQRQGRLDEVESAVRSMMEFYPEQKAVRYQLANFMVEQGRVDDAEQLLRETMAMDADDVTARLKLAEFLANRRDPETAETALRGFIDEAPDVYQFRFALARLYQATQRKGEAEDIYKTLIELDGTGPQGLSARNLLARIQLENRAPEKAAVLIDEVLEAEPSNAEALMIRAGMAFNDGDTDTAIADLRTALRNDPTSERVLFMLGQAHLRDGDANLAEENFRKLLSAHPTNRDASLALARLLIQQENWNDAEQLLARVLAASEEDMSTKRMLVDVLIRQGDYEGALAHAQDIADSADQKGLGHYMKGRIFQAQRQYDDAIASYKTSLDLQPKALESLSGLIGSYLSKPDTAAAKAYLQTYLETYDDSFHAHTLLGQVHARLDEWDRARAGFEQAIALNPQWLPAYRDLAGAELRNDAPDAALAAVERGLVALPESNDLQMLKAGILEQEERFPEAIAAYEVVVDRNPELDVAANNFAALIADHQQDRLPRALEVARRFETNDNPLFLDTLGWVYFRMGNNERALPLLEQAVAGAGQVAQLRYHLGMAYFRAGQPERARTELQAAIDGTESSFVGLDEARATLASL